MPYSFFASSWVILYTTYVPDVICVLLDMICLILNFVFWTEIFRTRPQSPHAKFKSSACNADVWEENQAKSFLRSIKF